MNIERIKQKTADLAYSQGFEYEGELTAPQSVLAKWLREEHIVEIVIHPFVDESFKTTYGSEILSLTFDEDVEWKEEDIFEKWEEAMEDALFSALLFISE